MKPFTPFLTTGDKGNIVVSLETRRAFKVAAIKLGLPMAALAEILLSRFSDAEDFISFFPDWNNIRKQALMAQFETQRDSYLKANSEEAETKTDPS